MTTQNFPYAPILAETEMTVSGSARNSYATAGWMARDEFANRAPGVPHWFRPGLIGRDEEARFFSWRFYYADSMLALRAQGAKDGTATSA